MTAPIPVSPAELDRLHELHGGRLERDDNGMRFLTIGRLEYVCSEGGVAW